MTSNKEINIASITKFYTAIVAIQLLDQLNLTLATKIESYLPPSWVRGSNIDKIRFGDLMTHRSGFETGNTDFENTLTYSAIKQYVEDGVTYPASRDYDNLNFAIFRILIPSLQNNLPNAPLANLESDQTTQTVYRSYMQKALFDKISLSNIDFTQESNNPTRYYNIDDPTNSISGITYGDWNHISGGGGYYMSVKEMAAVNAYFEHTEILVSDEVKTLIKDNYLGLDAYFDGDDLELYGKYFGKDGRLSTSSNPNINQGVITQIQMFPSVGVEIVVVVNTRTVTYKSGIDDLRSTIKEAFNDAFE